MMHFKYTKGDFSEWIDIDIPHTVKLFGFIELYYLNANFCPPQFDRPEYMVRIWRFKYWTAAGSRGWLRNLRFEYNRKLNKEYNLFTWTYDSADSISKGQGTTFLNLPFVGTIVQKH